MRIASLPSSWLQTTSFRGGIGLQLVTGGIRWGLQTMLLFNHQHRLVLQLLRRHALRVSISCRLLLVLSSNQVIRDYNYAIFLGDRPFQVALCCLRLCGHQRSRPCHWHIPLADLELTAWISTWNDISLNLSHSKPTWVLTKHLLWWLDFHPLLIALFG